MLTIPVPMTPHSRNNLNQIENFLLYHFAPDAVSDNTEYDQMIQSARDYISEDHVDGEDSEEAYEQRPRIVENLCHLAIVEGDADLLAQFRREYGTSSFDTKTLIEADMLKPKVAQLYKRLAKKKNPYFQPVLTAEEWETAKIPSFGVYKTARACNEAHPFAPVGIYFGDEIEEPTFIG